MTEGIRHSLIGTPIFDTLHGLVLPKGARDSIRLDANAAHAAAVAVVEAGYSRPESLDFSTLQQRLDALREAGVDSAAITSNDGKELWFAYTDPDGFWLITDPGERMQNGDGDISYMPVHLSALEQRGPFSILHPTTKTEEP